MTSAVAISARPNAPPERSRREGVKPAPQCFTVPAEHGGTISLAIDGYELVGPQHAPVLIVLGGISAHRHAFAHAGNSATGWWNDFIGEQCAIDPRCYRVLSLDYGWRADGPVDTRDQARLIAAVLDRLGIDSIHAIIGSSYGGMVGLAFASLFPKRIERLVAISAAHESHPMATAVRVVQRRIIQLARSAGNAREGVALARALGVTTYRTTDEFAERFVSEPVRGEHGFRFPVEDYLDYNAERFAETFPAARYLALSESLDLHRVDPKSISAAVTLIAIDRDTLVPSWQMRELFAWLGGPGRFVEISSRFGHDAFLKEVAAISEVVGKALGGRHVA